MLDNFQKAESSFDGDLKLAVQFVADDLLYLQREKQLFQGIGNDGRIIGRYSRATEEITQGLTGVGYPKKSGDPFNFYAGGSLFKSWTYQFKDKSKLQLIATDAKTDELQRRYPKMTGLTEANEQEFNYNYLVKSLRGIIARHFIR